MTDPGDTLPDAVVRYADHEDGLLDLHVPEGRARGTVVLLHGGFWRFEHDRVHTRPVAVALRDAGFLVATPEYRRTGAPEGRAGGWPATFTDVRTSVERLPELLAGIGVQPATPVTVLGHSAGGHLALWLAGESLPLDRVVALAPVGDLRDAYRRDLGEGAVRALLGGAPDDHPARYAVADPATRLAAAAPCEVLVLHGTADDHVPAVNSDWARPLEHVELHLLEGVDHFAVIDPASRAWLSVIAALA